jgi:hypothetical protein
MLPVASARTLALVAGLVAHAAAVEAQTRFTVAPKLSLAWWQVNPHLNHLWATTCPQEPTWRPGEGRSTGWIIGAGLRAPKHGYGGDDDTTIIPVYPRFMPLPVCTEAVSGGIVVTDTTDWREVRGEVVVKAEALVTGHEQRDAFARSAVLETRQYPTLRFTIDSVVDVSRQADTVRAKAVGVFHVHGVTKAVTAGVRGWPEAGGVRVLAKFSVPAQILINEFGLSRMALDLGVKTGIWYQLFMGIDVVLHADAAGGD